MNLTDMLNEGGFITLVEMEPPKGVDMSAMIENASNVKDRVNAFVVTEMNNAVMRMSSLGGALSLQTSGFNTIMQVCCRDRNRLALQADILAAGACGIETLIAVKGEDPSFGDHHQAKAVYDISLMELLEAVQTLRQGKDMAGGELNGALKMEIGSTVNAALKDDALKIELEEMNKKQEAGVSFFITPPLFDLTAFEQFLSLVDRQKTNIIPTVLLLKSTAMARYMAKNIDNITIPEELLRRLQKTPFNYMARECVSIAREMIDTLKTENFAGAMISTIGWEDKLPDILRT